MSHQHDHDDCTRPGVFRAKTVITALCALALTVSTAACGNAAAGTAAVPSIFTPGPGYSTAHPAAAGSIIDRSGGRADLGVPRFALATLEVKSWDPQDCPLCREGIPVEKPGSRSV